MDSSDRLNDHLAQMKKWREQRLEDIGPKPPSKGGSVGYRVITAPAIGSDSSDGVGWKTVVIVAATVIGFILAANYSRSIIEFAQSIPWATIWTVLLWVASIAALLVIAAVWVVVTAILYMASGGVDECDPGEIIIPGCIGGIMGGGWWYCMASEWIARGVATSEPGQVALVACGGAVSLMFFIVVSVVSFFLYQELLTPLRWHLDSALKDGIRRWVNLAVFFGISSYLLVMLFLNYPELRYVSGRAQPHALLYPVNFLVGLALTIWSKRTAFAVLIILTLTVVAGITAFEVLKRRQRMSQEVT